MNLWAVFLTGLTTGGLSCLAMQGGLLAGIIANQKGSEMGTEESAVEVKSKHLTRQDRRASQQLQSISKIKDLSATFDSLDWLPVGLFLLAKLITHTILGFFLGWLGSKMELNLTVRLFFQVAAALFMLATAGNLLELHPIFRYVVIQPPKFLNKIIRGTTKSRALFTPFLLGLLTILIPCGVTQAMEVLAITSGSPVNGALIMFFFVLGTSPLFALIGVATARLSEGFRQKFLKIAAAALIFLGLSSINGVLVVLDSPISFEKITSPITYYFSDKRFDYLDAVTSQPTASGEQTLLINIDSNGYSPSKLTAKVGVPVNLTLKTNNSYSCASSFVMKAFNIKLQLAPTDSKTVVFTPTAKGKYPFSCSMGMYSGVIEVI